MSLTTETNIKSLEALATAFFKQSDGQWRSQRRYYTLKSGDTQEVISDLGIQFLDQGDASLQTLAKAHQLTAAQTLVCGVKFTWESHYISPSRKQSVGSTSFGILGNQLYRDRGFATPKPVVATYKFINDQTMQLHTEYSGSSFDEELKLIGANYRTRQTIIRRASEEIMIGQYLETRVS